MEVVHDDLKQNEFEIRSPSLKQNEFEIRSPSNSFDRVCPDFNTCICLDDFMAMEERQFRLEHLQWLEERRLEREAMAEIDGFIFNDEVLVDTSRPTMDAQVKDEDVSNLASVRVPGGSTREPTVHVPESSANETTDMEVDAQSPTSYVDCFNTNNDSPTSYVDCFNTNSDGSFEEIVNEASVRVPGTSETTVHVPEASTNATTDMDVDVVEKVLGRDEMWFRIWQNNQESFHLMCQDLMGRGWVCYGVVWTEADTRTLVCSGFTKSMKEICLEKLMQIFKVPRNVHTPPPNVHKENDVWATPPPNVELVYALVQKHTGGIGGNAESGPIYGELTKDSMHQMVNLMIEQSNLNQESRFLDVGSGIGKPNLHVAQYPGVAFSCGVELQENRWVLSMACLKAVLEEAATQSKIDTKANILGNTIFLNNDIMDAGTFDPFTHVYMFSIGFPPELWETLALMWKRSHTPYLISYHNPHFMNNKYKFDLELLAKRPTVMRSSHERHTGYIYKRKEVKEATQCCDVLFEPSLQLVTKGLHDLQVHVSNLVDDIWNRPRKTRCRKIN
jgi:hypothetical protein